MTWFGTLVRGRDGGGAGIVIVMLPCQQLSVTLRACFDLNEAGRAEVGPGELFSAGPDHLDGLAGGLRQTRCFKSGFAGMFSAVTAAHIRLDDAHLRGRNVKGLRQLIANAEGTLGSGPDGQIRAIPLRDGGARLKRRMGDVLHGIAASSFRSAAAMACATEPATCCGPLSRLDSGLFFR